MGKVKTDPEREHRITMEIVVDAYGEEECAMSWYYYLEDRLVFPFTARCVAKRSTSPLRVKDEAEVIGMATEDECSHEMFVMIHLGKDGLAVPLSQIAPVTADEQTCQAIEDWHYWVKKGYEF